MAVAQVSEADFVRLYQGNVVPLRVALAGFTWVIYEYFVTLEEEVHYIWSQDQRLGRFIFLWIRYYTIALVAFDTLQIHTFAIPRVATDRVCLIIAPVTRILGAISLWSVEIIMQLRVYALFNASRQVAIFNGVLFAFSIAVYLWILSFNSMRRGALIAVAKHLPLPGCPAINGGTEWALWIPPTVFESILFLFVAYSGAVSIAARIRVNERISLTTVLINENCLYFFSVCCLLIFNNLMVVGATKIPWFGFAPFHGAIGIVTCRVFLHLRRFDSKTLQSQEETSTSLEMLQFAHVTNSGSNHVGSRDTLESASRTWLEVPDSRQTEMDTYRSDPKSLTPTPYV